MTLYCVSLKPVPDILQLRQILSNLNRKNNQSFKGLYLVKKNIQSRTIHKGARLGLLRSIFKSRIHRTEIQYHLNKQRG